MGMTTSVFHTYGLLITEETAAIVLQHVKELGIHIDLDAYKAFEDSEDLYAFQKYLSDEYNGCRYGNTDYMTVWRLKNHEEMNLNLGEEIYIIELQNFPQLFSRAYSSYESVIQEMRHTLGDLLPPDFPFDDFLVEIMGEIWG